MVSPRRIYMRLVMRSLLLAAFVLVAAAPARAQLAPYNASGVTYGHVHVSTGNADAMKKMWIEQFGAVLATKGTFTIAKLPGMMVAFRATAPTGGTEGAAMD